MPTPLKVTDHQTVEEIQEAYQKCRDVKERERWQVVLLRDFYHFFADRGAHITFGMGQTGTFTVWAQYRGHAEPVRTVSLISTG